MARPTLLATEHELFVGDLIDQMRRQRQEKSQSYSNLPYFQSLGSEDVFEVPLYSHVKRVWQALDRVRQANLLQMQLKMQKDLELGFKAYGLWRRTARTFSTWMTCHRRAGMRRRRGCRCFSFKSAAGSSQRGANCIKMLVLHINQRLNSQHAHAGVLSCPQGAWDSCFHSLWLFGTSQLSEAPALSSWPCEQGNMGSHP